MTDQLPPQPTTPPPPAEPPAVPALPSPAKRPVRPLTAGLLGLAIGAAIVGAAWAVTAENGPGDPGTFTLEGTFELTEGATSDDNGGCMGTGGYDDIREGTGVTVYGAGGDVIATGAIQNPDFSGLTCTFDVKVEDVPKGEKFYKVEVSHRGTLQLTAQEAQSGQFAGSLG
ncbi:hypothetical protein AB0N77_32990 [Streptomyces misionensis]|uniref:hypothetical protein n=1 Tax=Streptomyces misionensis TaxID=67331 RepID=UPI003418560D